MKSKQTLPSKLNRFGPKMAETEQQRRARQMREAQQRASCGIGIDESDRGVRAYRMNPDRGELLHQMDGNSSGSTR